MAFDAVTRAALPSAEVTHLHLFRHGKVQTGGARLVYGHLDLPLDPEGLRQGEALVDFAARHLPRPDLVLSSDLARCRGPAEALARRLDAPLRVFPELREQDMGAWEGRSWAELTVAHEAEVRAYWTDYLDARPGGGESLRDLALRLDAWWDREVALLRGRRLLVVTHTGVVRVLCCRHLGLPLDQALRFAPPPASHTHLLHAEAGSVLQALGERVLPLGDSDHVAGDAPDEAARPPRIALSGSAGTGKTTLGRALAAALDLPYLAEGMRRRLESGLDLHQLDHRALQDLLQQLWEEQQADEDAAIAAHGGFVADRSSADYAAFWLHYGFAEDRDATARFYGETLRHLARYDRVVLLPWGVLPLQADGVRSTNPWIQRRFQALVEGLLHRELVGRRLLLLPAEAALERRVAWVLDRVPRRG
jgi:broad specificity phosphatase PhoE/nicotinamide riboside kinase